MRIVVVDDHLPTIELMRLTLTSFGHSVRSAADVASARRLIADQRPDVVLSDLTFPAGADGGEGGHDLARALRSSPEYDNVALVALTGAASPSEHEAALASGFDEVIVKPFDVSALVERIESFGSRRYDR